MKNCRDIESLLPFYDEDVLSDAEKHAVEEHLKSCMICRKELAYLQESGKLVNDLPDVEEPPWFQQKIMAEVRKVAEKKSFAQKWFYPLRIKIPVQIMATIVIAVLAVYIYRSSDEQVKQILPGVPPSAIETQKEDTPPVTTETKDTIAPAVPRKKADVREERSEDKKQIVDRAAGGMVQQSAEPSMKPQASFEADAGKAKAVTVKKDEVHPAVQAVPEQKSVEAGFADQEKQAEDRASVGMAKKKGSYKVMAPAAPRSMTASVAPLQQAIVWLRVENPAVAEANVEKILAGYDAKNKSGKMLDGRVIVQAEVSGKYWQDILLKLKKMGQLEEKAIPKDIGERDIRVVVEISGQ